jgi:hypothetical protein
LTLAAVTRANQPGPWMCRSLSWRSAIRSNRNAGPIRSVRLRHSCGQVKPTPRH